MRYVSGSEPESLDPHIPTGQPEARILIALYDGLVEYHPKTMEPIPSLAESWDVSEDGTVYTFKLRRSGRFSNGDPVTAHDFVYSMRRALAPELAAQNSYLAYSIKNAEDYNAGKLPAEALGVEALDDHTYRLTLKQPAPYFVGLLCHQFFRVVHKPTIEKHGKTWTKPENIVTSGSFTLREYRPYDRIIVVKDPNHWDADMVRLDRIEFYPLEETPTMMNLYKSGDLYAVYNHVPPAAWNSVVSGYKDEYLNFPQLIVDFYTFNVTKPPMNDLRVRQAFNLAVDRDALAKFRRTSRPLIDFTPIGIFPKYEEARRKVYAEELAKIGSSLEEWQKRKYDPEKARELLAEAGFPVERRGNAFVSPSFPVDQIELLYNTAESNRAVAEFIQAQWKQNLGITVTLRNQEFRTFLATRKKLDYLGMARAGWIGDFVDPVSFLKLFYTQNNDSSTGWHDPEFDRLLDEANSERDPQKRYEILAKAELYMLLAQPVMPLQVASTNWMKKPFVKGMYPNPGTLHAWKFVYIERDESKWDRDVENIMNVPDGHVDSNLARINATQEEFVRSKTEAGK
jgi:oligopeptide transport system substrate-binding protein